MKSLAVDYLKIDGDFVVDLVRDPVDRAMVEAINKIGHAIGVKTVAEYVEDEETLAALTAIGIDFAQGFILAEPGPLEQLLTADWRFPGSDRVV